ncbi:unnamed protein product [Pleuronectes platessa]|uniref:Uncharacterized protein n=1 Tax=Pleuronectes platessa TaxID=8262 RepID=A0A9N7ULJ4_PLEPL|nr:unnamed protein product [Pleuronectes platessa]
MQKLEKQKGDGQERREDGQNKAPAKRKCRRREEEDARRLLRHRGGDTRRIGKSRVAEQVARCLAVPFPRPLHFHASSPSPFLLVLITSPLIFDRTREHCSFQVLICISRSLSPRPCSPVRDSHTPSTYLTCHRAERITPDTPPPPPPPPLSARLRHAHDGLHHLARSRGWGPRLEEERRRRRRRRTVKFTEKETQLLYEPRVNTQDSLMTRRAAPSV